MDSNQTASNSEIFTNPSPQCDKSTESPPKNTSDPRNLDSILAGLHESYLSSKKKGFPTLKHLKGNYDSSRDFDFADNMLGNFLSDVFDYSKSDIESAESLPDTPLKSLLNLIKAGSSPTPYDSTSTKNSPKKSKAPYAPSESLNDTSKNENPTELNPEQKSKASDPSANNDSTSKSTPIKESKGNSFGKFKKSSEAETKANAKTKSTELKKDFDLGKLLMEAADTDSPEDEALVKDFIEEISTKFSALNSFMDSIPEEDMKSLMNQMDNIFGE